MSTSRRVPCPPRHEHDVELRRVREGVVGLDAQALGAAHLLAALRERDHSRVVPQQGRTGEDLPGADGVELLQVVEQQDSEGRHRASSMPAVGEISRKRPR